MPFVQLLRFNQNQIGDAGIQALATAITPGPDGKGALASLQTLVLQDNSIGDAGLTAFADAVRSGALDKLQTLELGGNRIADDGMKAFAIAVEKGALDKLQVCWRPSALPSCLETPHVHSPDSEHLFDVPCADALARQQQHF